MKEKNCEIFYTIAQFFEEKFFVKFLDGGKNFKFLFHFHGTYIFFKVLGAIYLLLFFHNFILLQTQCAVYVTKSPEFLKGL